MAVEGGGALTTDVVGGGAGAFTIASSGGGKTGPCGFVGGICDVVPNSTHSIRCGGNSLKCGMQLTCCRRNRNELSAPSTHH